MTLPEFRYHPDPIASGSIVVSSAMCRCCGRSRGYIYEGPVYATAELIDALCPWCIADGSAHAKFDATFTDSEAFPDGTPASAVEGITERTPGYNAWQSEHWPMCCDDATAFVMPAGIVEIREHHREWEGAILNHIIYEMEISGWRGDAPARFSATGRGSYCISVPLSSLRTASLPRRRAVGMRLTYAIS